MAAKKRRGDSKIAVQNAMKTLLANVRFASVDRPIQSLAITSSKPKEGKSTTAYNLACAIASSGASVVLVECDMRRRTLASLLRVHAQHGLYSVLSEQVALEDALVKTDQANLFFLDCEPQIPNPADIIASRRFADLMARLESQFRYVIVDTPPVGAFVDAAEVGQLVDGVLFVVRENFTKRSEAVAAVEQLRKGDVNIIGTVMSFCDGTSNDYYSYYSKGAAHPVDSSLFADSEAVARVEQASGARPQGGGSRFAKR